MFDIFCSGSLVSRFAWRAFVAIMLYGTQAPFKNLRYPTNIAVPLQGPGWPSQFHERHSCAQQAALQLQRSLECDSRSVSTHDVSAWSACKKSLGTSCPARRWARSVPPCCWVAPLRRGSCEMPRVSSVFCFVMPMPRIPSLH